MFSLDKQIGDYRVRQTDTSVVIDEQKGPVSSFFDFIFGLVFMFPLGFLLGYLLMNGLDPMASQISVGHWLIILPFLCVPFVFAYVGAFMAFVRSHVEVTREQFLKGITWCGVPLKLKATPVSEIRSVQLKWEPKEGSFAGGWNCVASAMPVKTTKPIRLFACSKRESALALASAVAGITNLPVQDVPQS